MNSRTKAGAGFTIVETMIVLGISGLMFVLAISAMSGRQQETEFNTGVDTLRSELNENLSNVANGNYSSLENTSCYASSAGGTLNIDSATPPGHSSSQCSVIGEVIQFGTISTGSNSYFTVYPVFGNTYYLPPVANSSPTFVTDIAESNPALSLGVKQKTVLPYQLTLTGFSPPMNSYGIYPGGGGGAIGVFDFTSFKNNRTYGLLDGSLNSGAEHVEIFLLPDSLYSGTPNVDNLSDDATTCGSGNVCIGTQTEPINPGGGITFCVKSGTDSEYAEFTIGGPNSISSASYQIYNGQGCT